jgi:hypothetical protein
MTGFDTEIQRRAPMAGRLLAALLPHDRREEFIGDLEEEYARLATASGPQAAYRWYVRQILLSIFPMACHRVEIAAARRMASWSSRGECADLQIGKAFFVATLLWVAFVSGVAHHRPSGMALPAIDLPAGPSYTVSLLPQAALPVETDSSGDFGRTDQVDFLNIGLIPPLALLIAIIAGLVVSDRMAAFRRKSILPVDTI